MNPVEGRETDMKEFYTIGEVSKIFNLPASTLRYYDEISLLCPWKMGENGYRYYSKAQFEMISMIAFMRSLGTPIERLKDILNEEDPSGIRNELGRYVCEIDDHIRHLEKLKKRAKDFDRDIAGACAGPDIRIERTPEMFMMAKEFGSEDELDTDEIFTANNQASEWATNAGIISTISAEDLLAGNFHSYEKYGYISTDPFPGESGYLEIVPERLCVCGNLCVRSVEHFEADEVYAAMLAFASENGCTAAGPAIEQNVLDMYCGKMYNPTIYFKIYIPVRKNG